jgi:drug/metabolite transporter (DMT)-like permease
MNGKYLLNGQTLVLLSAVLYGLNPLFAQLLFKDGLNSSMVSLYRFAIPALFFVFFLRTPKDNWVEAARSFALGIGSGISIFAYFHALDTLPAATAILIYYSYPMFSVLIGWLVFNRMPTQNALVSAALIAIAASLTVRPESFPTDALISVLACFLAPIAVATQVQYLSRPKAALPTLNRMAWITFGHVFVLLPIALLSAPIQLLPVSSSGILAVIGVALFAAALPQFLFMIGAPRSTVNRNALMGSCEMVVALVTGAILLGDSLGQLDITAILLMLLALLITPSEIHTTKEHGKTPESPPTQAV